MLLSEKDAARANGTRMENVGRIEKVKKSMSRLKLVLGERGREYKALKDEQMKPIREQMKLAVKAENAALAEPWLTIQTQGWAMLLDHFGRRTATIRGRLHPGRKNIATTTGQSMNPDVPP